MRKGHEQIKCYMGFGDDICVSQEKPRSNHIPKLLRLRLTGDDEKAQQLNGPKALCAVVQSDNERTEESIA